MLGYGIFSEPSVPSEAHDSEESLAKDASVHLAHTLTTIHKDYGHFLNLISHLVCGVLHLYLEGIALEAYLIQWYRLEHTTTVALESGCSVMDVESGDKALISTRPIGQFTTLTPLT